MKRPIGEIIKERRIELNLTEEQLAAKLGYRSKSTINKIELGVNGVPYKKIEAFAEALNTTISYLTGQTEDPSRTFANFITDKYLLSDHLTEREKALLIAYRSADPAIQAAVRKLLDVEDPS